MILAIGRAPKKRRRSASQQTACHSAPSLTASVAIAALPDRKPSKRQTNKNAEYHSRENIPAGVHYSLCLEWIEYSANSFWSRPKKKQTTLDRKDGKQNKRNSIRHRCYKTAGLGEIFSQRREDRRERKDFFFYFAISAALREKSSSATTNSACRRLRDCLWPSHRIRTCIRRPWSCRSSDHRGSDRPSCSNSPRLVRRRRLKACLVSPLSARL